MAIVKVSVVPVGTGSTSLSRYVADCQRILQNQSEVHYELTAMGTVLEGDLHEILRLVQKMHEVPYEQGVRRVVTLVEIDDRRDKKASMRQKISSVREKM